MKKKPKRLASGLVMYILKKYGGESGTRTHVGLRPNSFQDCPVMTASVSLHRSFVTRNIIPQVKIKMQVYFDHVAKKILKLC